VEVQDITNILLISGRLVAQTHQADLRGGVFMVLKLMEHRVDDLVVQ
jgi:hypothetical protein